MQAPGATITQALPYRSPPFSWRRLRSPGRWALDVTAWSWRGNSAAILAAVATRVLPRRIGTGIVAVAFGDTPTPA